MQTQMGYVEKDVREIKDTLKTLPEDITAKLDERYVRREEFNAVQETVAPFTRARKWVWGLVVVEGLGLSALIADKIF